jgi:hypothetical protein
MSGAIVLAECADMFRRKADQIIDRAHNAICNAEMSLMHSFTDESHARYGAELAQAQRFLARAVAAKLTWEATEHDDYEEYPEVPETDMDMLL